MTRDEAMARYRALGNMTVARGCTEPEAATAARLRRMIDEEWNFSSEQVRRGPIPNKGEAERWYWANVMVWNWEHRKCGKKNCWCAGAARGHGPYKYAKRRVGKKVASIYLGT